MIAQEPASEGEEKRRVGAPAVSLTEASDYELMVELARRKKAKAAESPGSNMRCSVEGSCEMFD